MLQIPTLDALDSTSADKVIGGKDLNLEARRILPHAQRARTLTAQEKFRIVLSQGRHVPALTLNAGTECTFPDTVTDAPPFFRQASERRRLALDYRESTVRTPFKVNSCEISSFPTQVWFHGSPLTANDVQLMSCITPVCGILRRIS